MRVVIAGTLGPCRVARRQAADRGQAVAGALLDDLRHRLDLVDAPGDLARQGDRGLHVAAEVEVHGVAEQRHGVRLGVELERVRALGAQRPQGGAGVLVEEHGVGLAGVEHRLLPVVVDRALGRAHHPGAQLHALGAEREGRGHGRRRPRTRRPRSPARRPSTRRAAAAPSSTPGAGS